MAKCEKCGAELQEGAAFCQKCGAPVAPVTTVDGARVIDLAGWGDRFIAFIIDAVIFGIIAGVINGIFFLPSISWNSAIPNYIPVVNSRASDLITFLYFLYMDLTYGQSLGKMVMKLKVTNLDGGPLTLNQAAIEAFGKAFLLPLDLIIGWIAFKDKDQRLFTYLAKTIVVKTR